MTIPFNQRVALVAGILLSLFLSIFASVSYFKTKVYVEQEMQAKQMSIMKAMRNDINGWMHPAMHLITNLSQELGKKQRFENNEIVPLLAHAKKAIGSVQVYFGLEDGRMMYDTGKELDRNWYNPRERPWYTQGIKANATTLSAPFVGFASNQLTLTIMSPVLVDGEKKGVVAASFYINKLYRKVKSIKPEQGYAYVVDQNGTIVLHPDKTMLGMNLQDQNPALKTFFESMRSNKEGIFEYRFGENDELLSFGKLYNGWYMVVSLKKTVATAFSDSMLRFFTVMGILMVALTIIVLLKMTEKSVEEH